MCVCVDRPLRLNAMGGPGRWPWLEEGRERGEVGGDGWKRGKMHIAVKNKTNVMHISSKRIQGVTHVTIGDEN